MTSFAAHITEDRRLCILRLLAHAPGYAANESILHTALKTFGHGVGRDQVRTDLAWLDEQGLVFVEDVGDIKVASASARGVEAAQGLVEAPGVKKPSAPR